MEIALYFKNCINTVSTYNLVPTTKFDEFKLLLPNQKNDIKYN